MTIKESAVTFLLISLMVLGIVLCMGNSGEASLQDMMRMMPTIPPD